MANDRKLRIVIKIGTSSLISTLPDGGTQLNLVHLAATIEAICKLKADGHDVVLVSSGAIGTGCHIMGLHEKPENLSTRQALAALGQSHLICKYEAMFGSLGLKCAQVLLTYENFVDRTQFLNAKNTLNSLFELGVVPIVNENDTVGVQELKADNDRLSAMVASALGECDLLFLMTDVGGVYTANPSRNPDAKRVPYLETPDLLYDICEFAENGISWGTGGMIAKITAAKLATSLGVRTLIMSADDVFHIPSYCKEYVHRQDSGKLAIGDPHFDPHFSFGTTLEKCSFVPRALKGWIRALQRRGALIVDDGAKQAVLRRKNLFAVGLKQVIGDFVACEAVSVLDLEKNEIAYALVNFSSSELKLIKGLRTNDVFQKLSQSGIIVSRKNMDVLIGENGPQAST